MLPPNRAGSTFPRVVREVAADIHALGGIRKLLEALVVCRTPPLPLRMLYLYLLIERVRIVQRRTCGSCTRFETDRQEWNRSEKKGTVKYRPFCKRLTTSKPLSRHATTG